MRASRNIPALLLLAGTALSATGWERAREDEARGDRTEVKWVELTADRTTHQYAGRLEFTMQITVKGDSLTAFETVKVFDAAGAPAPAPETPKPLLGARVRLP